MDEITRTKGITFITLITALSSIFLIPYVHNYLNNFNFSILILGNLFFGSLLIANIFVFINSFFKNNFWWMKNFYGDQQINNPYKSLCLTIILTFSLSLVLSFICFLAYSCFSLVYYLYL